VQITGLAFPAIFNTAQFSRNPEGWSIKLMQLAKHFFNNFAGPETSAVDRGNAATLPDAMQVSRRDG
jgi:hypothetical protein